MAVGTAGTNATTSLSALRWNPGYGSGVAAADIATFNATILTDDARQIAWPEGFCLDPGGVLYIPRRGRIIVQPGDVLWSDSKGGVGLIPNYAITNGPWTKTV